MTREEAINILWMYDVNFEPHPAEEVMHAIDMAIEALRQPECKDAVSRQAAIDALDKEYRCTDRSDDLDGLKTAMLIIENLPSAQPERVWISCDTPPEHHRDVIVRGIEAIGNVTVHKVMQWDVDTWRPTDYAPSVMWKEWSEI